jgi:hypothetical protein
LEQFKTGDLVCLHDPTHKRGKAKKFSYQYNGPFEIESKISPLIYRVRTGEGMSTVVHVNRLKRAYGQELETLTSTSTLPKTKTSKRRQPKQVLSEDREDEFGDGEGHLEIKSNPQVKNVDGDSAEELEQRETLQVRLGEVKKTLTAIQARCIYKGSCELIAVLRKSRISCVRGQCAGRNRKHRDATNRVARLA